jgi:hypothetical protein
MLRRLGILVGIVAATAATSTLSAQDPTISREDLIDGGWRLGGMIFATMPVGGFPITFRDDGTVLTQNLRSVSTWSLTDGVLRLHDTAGAVYYRFDWLPRKRVFRDCLMPSEPSLVIFQNEPFSLDVLSVRCENGAPEPSRTFGVSCRLEVVPARIREGEAVEFRYVIASPDSQRVSGRYVRLDEETFGHSIHLRTDSGEHYRFLRTSFFSYLATLDTDTGDVTPQTYHFRFPARYASDNARLVTARDWNHVQSANDSASNAGRERVFAAGATSIPPGSYMISAELSYQLFWTRDRFRDGNYPEADALRCTPARLVVSP